MLRSFGEVMGMIGFTFESKTYRWKTLLEFSFGRDCFGALENVMNDISR